MNATSRKEQPQKHILTKKVDDAILALEERRQDATVFQGDCYKLLKKIPDDCVDLTISSPPYCMGKRYKEYDDVKAFVEAHTKILPEIVRITKPGGSICWQVGFHVKKGAVTPLDFLIHDILGRIEGITLRNRIVWTFGHGLHCATRFSGRYEVVMWYTKGSGKYHFDLDAVRVPQKYPGKRSSKGPNKGELSGNPKGKNPADIWDIPNVKARHIEKTDHPCQFPVALATRLVRALAPEGGLVLDPFSGVASAGVAAVLEGRQFLGAELKSEYAKIGVARLKDALAGDAQIRPVEKEIYTPKSTEKVAIKPDHFWSNHAQQDMSAGVAKHI